jgi:hypothetical protein
VPVVGEATKRSPFGAVRIRRGVDSPAANSSTLKPAGTCGHAPAGRVMILEPESTERVA